MESGQRMYCFFGVFIFCVFLASQHAGGILVPRPGIEPVPPAVEAQSLNRWTSREVPFFDFFRHSLLPWAAGWVVGSVRGPRGVVACPDLSVDSPLSASVSNEPMVSSKKSRHSFSSADRKS